MSIAIHFFRNRSLERIDYEKLIDYFDSMETCHINYYEDVVEMVYTDPVFDFPYRFLITKRSQVKSIYNLKILIKLVFIWQLLLRLIPLHYLYDDTRKCS